MKKRIINSDTPKAKMFFLGNGRYALNAIDGVACTLTGAHHYAGNITHPRQGFREMGVLEIQSFDELEGDEWICEDRLPTPQTKDGCAPAITPHFLKTLVYDE